jgi:hypothetical protein
MFFPIVGFQSDKNVPIFSQNMVLSFNTGSLTWFQPSTDVPVSYSIGVLGSTGANVLSAGEGQE